jgi:hypothetical protein
MRTAAAPIAGMTWLQVSGGKLRFNPTGVAQLAERLLPTQVDGAEGQPSEVPEHHHVLPARSS